MVCLGCVEECECVCVWCVFKKCNFVICIVVCVGCCLDVFECGCGGDVIVVDVVIDVYGCVCVWMCCVGVECELMKFLVWKYCDVVLCDVCGCV